MDFQKVQWQVHSFFWFALVIYLQLSSTESILFAHDTTILISGHNIKHFFGMMNAELHQVVTWYM